MPSDPPKIPHIDYTKADILVEEIIEDAGKYLTDIPRDELAERVRETYIFAREAHASQVRKSGEPYITHPLEATKILLSLKPDLVSIQSCILHDVIEDTERTEDDIREKFGDNVATICQ